MSALESTLAQFGQSLSLPGLELNESGVAVMEIEDYGRIYLERHRNGLVMLLLREITGADLRHYTKALSLCDPREKLPFQPLAALRSPRELVLGFYFEEASVTVPALQQALEELGRLHDQVAAN